MFKEIVVPAPILLDVDLVKANGHLLHAVNVKDRATVASYQFQNQSFIEAMMCKIFKFNIKPHYIGYIEFNLDHGDVHPHTDTHRFALNLILEDQGAVTKFWTTTHGPRSFFPGSDNYDIRHCHQIGEFKATTGSAWLYDLKIIHSVHGSKNIRKLVSVRWAENGMTFDQMYNSIELL